MKGKVLISACLLGRNCRYDGSNCYDKTLVKLLRSFRPIGVCPEELAGFKKKRGPFELKGKASDIFLRKNRVVDIKGKDVTGMFIQGAKLSFKIAKENNIRLAILKSKSPSCSPDFIYNGSFSKILKEGLGLFAYLLKNDNVVIVSNEEFVKRPEYFISKCRGRS